MSEPVVQSLEIEAPVTRDFELLTTADQLVLWWPEAAVFEPREGGDVRLEFEQGVVHGRVTHFDPPHALSFTWIRAVAPDVETLVEITLTERGGGRTRLELRHSGFEQLRADEIATWRALHEAGWRHFLRCLRDLAAGRPVDKAWPA